MNIERPNGNDWIGTHALYERMDNCGEFKLKHVIEQFLKAETIPDFYTIELETFNRCNGICPFCPVNRHIDPRQPYYMDENLFDSIIDQLHYMDYHGNLSLFSNNEPLLDNRIFRFIEKATSKLPNAKHHLFTNGTLLDKDKFLHLVNHLDSLYIDNYNDDMELIPSVQKIVDLNLEENWKCNVTIAMRKQNQKLTTRGGNAPNRKDEENLYHRHSPCILPFTQLIIRSNGTIAKCCNDPIGDMTLGDLNQQTMLEVWRGKLYRELRQEMYNNGTARIPGCNVCDAAYGIYNYAPSYMFVEAKKHFVDEIKLRRNLRDIYILDKNPYSENIFKFLSEAGVTPKGYVDISENNLGGGGITLLDAFNQHAYLIIPTLYYPDEAFNFLHSNGYKWRDDYLIFD